MWYDITTCKGIVIGAVRPITCILVEMSIPIFPTLGLSLFFI